MNKLRGLTKLGLSEKEAQMYIATIEVGNGSAPAIAAKAGVPKATAHDILKTLNRKGLVHKYPKGKRSYFTAVDPKLLKDKLEKQLESAETLVPELQAMFRSVSTKPHVRYYEGKEGKEVCLREMLDEATELLVITAAKESNMHPEYYPMIPEKRAEAGIPARIIFRDSKDAREYKKQDREQLRQSKIVDFPVPYTSGLWVWGNKVSLSNYKDNPSTIIIEDQETANFHRAMFETLWRDARESA